MHSTSCRSLPEIFYGCLWEGNFLTKCKKKLTWDYQFKPGSNLLNPAEPWTELQVRFITRAELWTGLRSSSQKFRFELRFWTELQQHYWESGNATGQWLGQLCGRCRPQLLHSSTEDAVDAIVNELVWCNVWPRKQLKTKILQLVKPSFVMTSIHQTSGRQSVGSDIR